MPIAESLLQTLFEDRYPGNHGDDGSGRRGAGWETISLIEGMGLKRDFLAVDQREAGPGTEKAYFTILFNFHD